MDAMKPGVKWADMHTLAYRTILTHLTAAGVLQCVSSWWCTWRRLRCHHDVHLLPRRVCVQR
jgi:hypothetical protein